MSVPFRRSSSCPLFVEGAAGGKRVCRVGISEDRQSAVYSGAISVHAPTRHDGKSARAQEGKEGVERRAAVPVPPRNRQALSKRLRACLNCPRTARAMQRILGPLHPLHPSPRVSSATQVPRLFRRRRPSARRKQDALRRLPMSPPPLSAARVALQCLHASFSAGNTLCGIRSACRGKSCSRARDEDRARPASSIILHRRVTVLTQRCQFRLASPANTLQGNDNNSPVAPCPRCTRRHCSPARLSEVCPREQHMLGGTRPRCYGAENAAGAQYTPMIDMEVASVGGVLLLPSKYPVRPPLAAG